VKDLVRSSACGASTPLSASSDSAAPLRVLDLFSGIGGFSLGLERTGGFETVAFCEIDPFRRRVLAKHWPGVPCFEDIRSLGAEQIARLGAVDAICGGFPCQDVSGIGQRRGLAGARSGLWREFARLVRQVRPAYVLVENVEGLRSRGLDDVLGDLAALGYDAEWDCVPAAYVGAPHPRDRIWIVAHRQEIGWGEAVLDVEGPQAPPAGQPPRNGPAHGRQWQPEPALGRVVHGLPDRVERVAALGDAIVPAMAEVIGRRVLASRAQLRAAA
jgi:DNA (cytosine-5)-methyltransferase 1